MSWSQCGSCPKCGAPIWLPMVYHSVLPPSPRFTCGCVRFGVITTTSTATVTA